MINSLFSFMAGVLSDPHDQQGSTKRLCLFLFLGTVMVLIALVTITATPMTLPAVPESILNLVYFVVGILTSAVVADKGIAAYKTAKAAEPIPGPPGPAGPQGPAGPAGPAGPDRPAGAL